MFFKNFDGVRMTDEAGNTVEVFPGDAVVLTLEGNDEKLGVFGIVDGMEILNDIDYIDLKSARIGTDNTPVESITVDAATVLSIEVCKE